ncbi:transmembrane protein 88-like [Protopterus annectens]|uniref:transmembrane protein 88-like n=1 Tax=Protopterus annectens TaxID=7888 RepID=UPI001CFB0533|nr:transmembrane protein 88-like [Protopterus annectens]
MSDHEIEDFEVDSLSDTSHMIPGPPAYNIEDHHLPLEPRSTCCYWVWTLVITSINFMAFLMNFAFMTLVFSIVLLPTIVVVYFGFQCHSRVLHSNAYYCKDILDDNSSSALIILGFVIMSPLIVVAMAIYCSLSRRLRLFLCFQPYARAVYKGTWWKGYDRTGICCCGNEWGSHVKAWV